MHTMTTQFDERKQEERLKELRAREEEQLAQILAEKYGVEYTDLTKTAIDTDALRILTEQEARSAEMALFHKANKVVFVGMRAPERSDSLNMVERIERLA